MKHILSFLIIISIFVSCSAPTNQEKNVPIRKKVGILGGMSPMATADFYANLVKTTPATKDQEHLPALIYSLPQTPDRTTSINNNDTAIYKFLREGLQLLEKNGAICIAMPCNTVHYYYDYMSRQTSVPIINMIKETALAVKQEYPTMEVIGLLATSATIEMRLYQKELENLGFAVVIPDDDIIKNNVMKAIYGIKSNVDNEINEDLLAEAGKHVVLKGAELIVLGCTEIPLAFNPKRVNVPVIDPAKVMAKKVIDIYEEMNKQ
jgi:aspartate racemase